jgi:Zn-dependent protease with chaperone function
MIRRIVFAAALLTASLSAQKQKQLKPGMNFFSVDQDIQLGKETAAQVQKQFHVIHDPALDNLIQSIGRKLVAQVPNNKFPFTFQVVNDKSINAFALPGGPMFIHTGLIAAADNEAQIAGVMGHEMGHVVLRHGTNQASKQNLISIPAALAGAVVGNNGGLLGSLANAGINLGASSVLLKFSRSAENEADLFGARLMSAAGYNPLELAHFFEKLEAESGKGSNLTQFLSDHPNPGNRVKAIEEDMKFYPQTKYVNDTGLLGPAKAVVQKLPAPPPKTPQQALNQSGADSAPVAVNVPTGFKQLRTSLYAMAVPADWKGSVANDGISAQVGSPDGILGNGELGHGVLVSIAKAAANDLNQDTQTLIQGMQKDNREMQVASGSQRTTVDSYPALVTQLQSRSNLRPGEKETDTLLTVLRPQGLFYAVFVSPESRAQAANSQFQQMIQSIRFAR